MVITKFIGKEREKKKKKVVDNKLSFKTQHTRAPCGRGRCGALNAATKAGVIPLNNS